LCASRRSSDLDGTRSLPGVVLVSRPLGFDPEVLGRFVRSGVVTDGSGVLEPFAESVGNRKRSFGKAERNGIGDDLTFGLEKFVERFGEGFGYDGVVTVMGEIFRLRYADICRTRCLL